MKSITLIITLLTLAIFASAQPKITYQTHSFLVGDRHDFYLAQDADEGKGGPNAFWDFSGLVQNGKNLTSYMMEPSATEKGLSMDPSTLALKENENIFYFKVSSTGTEHFGSYGGGAFIKFSKPFVKMKYPLTYGDVYSGDYSGMQESGNSNIPISGTYQVEADAYGTLILPNGVYNNTLRVKQTLLYSYNHSGAEIKEVTYRWYSFSVRYPLLVIIKYEMNGQTTTERVAYFAHYSNENIKSEPSIFNFAVNAELGISPNPFINDFDVSFKVNSKSQVSMDLYDASGNKVFMLMTPADYEAGKYSKNFAISSTFPIGYYYVKATIGDQIIIKKIVKI
jgi:hypothetical protein